MSDSEVNVLKRPKYANHIFSRVFQLDSASFLYRSANSDPVYCICDRHSPFVKGENPVAKVSLIKEPNRPYQLRIGIRGSYHIEPLSYFVKDPREWIEWIWIVFPQSVISDLRLFLTEICALIGGKIKLWEVLL